VRECLRVVWPNRFKAKENAKAKPSATNCYRFCAGARDQNFTLHALSRCRLMLEDVTAEAAEVG